jgi:hypothetical protein
MGILTFNQYINEQQIDAASFAYTGVTMPIPDEVAEWAMLYYAVQHGGEIIKPSSVPKALIEASKALVLRYDGMLFRGLRYVGKKMPAKMKTGPANGGVSWTFDEDTAASFARPAKGIGSLPVILRLDPSVVKCMFSMDIVMENVTLEQVVRLKNAKAKKCMKDGYVSESEFIVLDELTVATV